MSSLWLDSCQWIISRGNGDIGEEDERTDAISAEFTGVGETGCKHMEKVSMPMMRIQDNSVWFRFILSLYVLMGLEFLRIIFCLDIEESGAIKCFLDTVFRKVHAIDVLDCSMECVNGSLVL